MQVWGALITLYHDREIPRVRQNAESKKLQDLSSDVRDMRNLQLRCVAVSQQAMKRRDRQNDCE